MQLIQRGAEMRARNMKGSNALARLVVLACLVAGSFALPSTSFAQTPKGSTVIKSDANARALLTVGGLGGLTSNRSCSSEQYVDAILSDNLNCSPLYNAIEPNNQNGNYFECPSSQGIIGFQTVGNVLQPICGSCTGTGNCTSFSPGFKESTCDAPKTNKFYTYPIIDNTNSSDIKIYCGCACGPGSVVSASPPGTTYPPNGANNLFTASAPPGYPSADGTYIEALCENACKTECCTDSCSAPTPTPGCVPENGFQTFSACSGMKTFAASIFTDINTCTKYCNCSEAPLGFPDLSTTYLPWPYPPFGFATTDLQSCLASCSANPPCNPPNTGTGTGTGTGASTDTGTSTDTSTGTGTGSCTENVTDISCPPPKVKSGVWKISIIESSPAGCSPACQMDLNGTKVNLDAFLKAINVFLAMKGQPPIDCQQLGNAIRDMIDGILKAISSGSASLCTDPAVTPTPTPDPCECKVDGGESRSMPGDGWSPPEIQCRGMCSNPKKPPPGQMFTSVGPVPPKTVADCWGSLVNLCCGTSSGGGAPGEFSGSYKGCCFKADGKPCDGFSGDPGGSPTPTPGDATKPTTGGPGPAM